MNAIIFLFSVCFLQSIAHGGFAAHTPVMLPTHEYTAIKDIRIGDTVLSHDGHNNFVARKVTDIQSRKTHNCVCVIVGNAHLITAYNQKFYLADQKRWKMAGCLLPGDKLLGESGKIIAIKYVLTIPRPVQLYDLTVEECHNFLVAKHGIIAHNFVPAVVIGATFAFGGGIEFTGLILGIGGIVLGTKGLLDWYKSRREQQQWDAEGLLQLDAAPCVQIQQPVTNSTCTFPYPNSSNSTPSRYTQQSPMFEPNSSISLAYRPSTSSPDNTLADTVKTTIADSVALTAHNYAFAKNNSHKKPKAAKKEEEKEKNTAGDRSNSAKNHDGSCPDRNDCKEQHPHGVYEDAGYHHKNSKGNGYRGKSAAPKNGQKALDSSTPIPKEGDSKNDSKRRIGVSDGEIVVLNETQPGEWHGHVRQWNELRQEMRNVLKKQGWATNKGKIIKSSNIGG